MIEQVNDSQEDYQEYENDAEVNDLPLECRKGQENHFSRDELGVKLANSEKARVAQKIDGSLGKPESVHTNILQPNVMARNKDGKYECDKCIYSTTHRGNLQTHKQSVHEGVKYECNKCNYKATQRSSLQRHQQPVHEGVKYNCNECDYMTHQRSVHEGVKYECKNVIIKPRTAAIKKVKKTDSPNTT